MLYDREKYKLIYNGEYTDLLEPIEWEDVEKEYVRNKNYHGLFLNLTSELTFTGDTMNLIVSIFESDGVNADVTFLRYVRNTRTDVWEEDFRGYLDFMTIVIKHDRVNIKVGNDNILSLLASKSDAEIEVERLTSLDGTEIGAVPIKKVYIEGRKLLLTGILEKEPNEEMLIIGASDGGRVLAPAFNETEQSEIKDFVPVLQSTSRSDVFVGYQEEMFMGYNDTGLPMELRVNVKMSFPIRVYYDGSLQSDNSNVSVKLRIAKFTGVANTFDSETIIWEWNGTDDYVSLESDEVALVLGLEDSAALQFYVQAASTPQVYIELFDRCEEYQGVQEDFAPPEYDDYQCAEPRPVSGSIVVQNDSAAVPSNANFILAHDFAAKMIKIITKASFRSKLLGRISMGYSDDGIFSAIGILHGLWLRGISANMDKYKPISMTWKNFYESLNVIYPIGLGIEGGTVVLEDRINFYVPIVTIKLGEVADLNIKADEKNYFSLLNIGYVKAGGYNEKQGLDDYNRETQYSTIIKRTDNKLELLSKVRSDSYGLETVRREVGDLTSDSSFDDNTWWLELLEVVGQNWEMSGWEDKFEKEPTGVYSPETAINLWLSPINIILRHGKWLRSSLSKYQDSKIAYTSSKGNSSLATKLIDGKEYKQNDGVPVIDLDYPIGNATAATFRSTINPSKLSGRTNGIKNIRGLVEFYSNNKKYTGFLNSVTIKNRVGEFSIKLFN